MNTYLIIIISILIISYLLDTIINLLNVRHVKERLPQEFEAGMMPNDTEHHNAISENKPNLAQFLAPSCLPSHS